MHVTVKPHVLALKASTPHTQLPPPQIYSPVFSTRVLELQRCKIIVDFLPYDTKNKLPTPALKKKTYFKEIPIFPLFSTKCHCSFQEIYLKNTSLLLGPWEKTMKR